MKKDFRYIKLVILGHQCLVDDISFNNDNFVKAKVTLKNEETKLSYRAPTFFNLGVPPLLSDPFEDNTVNVKKSTIIDADEGLFVTRDIKAGAELCT